MKRICPYCQQSFIPKRMDAVYCCPSHKQMAYKQRKMNLSVNLKSLHRLQFSENDAEPSTTHVEENAEHLAKSIYPSTNGSGQNQKPSINTDLKNYPLTKTIYPSIKKISEEENPSTKMIYPSIELSEKNEKPSINFSDAMDYPSTKQSNQQQKPSINTGDTTNYPSIDTLDVNTNKQNKVETQYIHHKSTFVDALMELTDQQDNISKLDPLFWNDTTGTYLWVSTRFKCLVECLLTFSETKTIELDSLKEICNAFTSLIRSNYFKSLPQAYPYRHEILELRQSLKKICLSSPEGKIKFSLLPQTKKQLIATRWELHYYVPKVNFNEMGFEG